MLLTTSPQQGIERTAKVLKITYKINEQKNGLTRLSKQKIATQSSDVIRFVLSQHP